MGILKYPKSFVLSLLLTAIGFVFLFWNSFSKGYYNSCVVTYDRYSRPLITTQIQNHSYDLEVRIGSRFPLFLNKETLDQIEKQAQGISHWHDIHGQQHEAPSYLIPKIKVGDLILTNIAANQVQDEGPGILGKWLGGEYNLFVDFPHSRIIACDSFPKLCKKLDRTHWAQAPFELTPGGITLNSSANFGNLRLVINTTSTRNLIRSSLAPTEKHLTSPTFSINGVELGSITFETIDLPDGLGEIDGFIGMDFLKNHAIYLDYAHKTAHIELSPIYFEKYPISFSKCGIPSVTASIEGSDYLLEIDLASSFIFSLNREILQNIHKTSYGTAEWSDFKGNKYQSPAYTVPIIKIGNLALTNAVVHQDRDDFHVNAALDALPSQQRGAIGLPILEKYNLFLNLPHSTIYACNSYVHLQRSGHLSKNLLAIPFILHTDGILLSIETDTGPHNFLLDTAATHTAMRAPHSGSTSLFRIKDHDFGTRSIMPIDLSSRFEYDGYLGLDFLREHPLYIDYPNKLIFLDLQLRQEMTSKF